MKLKTNILLSIFGGLLAVGSLFAAYTVIGQQYPQPNSAPGNNAPSVVSVGSTAQVKQGDLGVTKMTIDGGITNAGQATPTPNGLVLKVNGSAITVGAANPGVTVSGLASVSGIASTQGATQTVCANANGDLGLCAQQAPAPNAPTAMLYFNGAQVTNANGSATVTTHTQTFTVGYTQADATECMRTVSPNGIANQTWSTSGQWVPAANNMSPGVNVVPNNINSVIYTFQCRNAANVTVSRVLTVNYVVPVAPTPVITITATPPSQPNPVAVNQNATYINWTVTNATSCTLTGGPGTAQTYSPTPNASVLRTLSGVLGDNTPTTFTVTCQNGAGQNAPTATATKVVPKFNSIMTGSSSGVLYYGGNGGPGVNCNVDYFAWAFDKTLVPQSLGTPTNLTAEGQYRISTWPANTWSTLTTTTAFQHPNNSDLQVVYHEAYNGNYYDLPGYNNDVLTQMASIQGTQSVTIRFRFRFTTNGGAVHYTKFGTKTWNDVGGTTYPYGPCGTGNIDFDPIVI